MSRFRSFAVCFALAATFCAMPGLSGNDRNESLPQDSTRREILETRDGSTWMGRTLSAEGDTVVFETEYAVLKVPKSNIRRSEILSAEEIRGGEYWFPNPNATRLFFAPTARMLKKGEGYFADFYIFFPSVSFGFSDHFTFGGGISIFPGVRLEDQLVFLTPKIGKSLRKNLDAAAGLLWIRLPNAHSLGIAYGVATLGSPDQSITAGMGYGYEDGRPARSPIFMIGAETRTSRHIGLVSENWFSAGLKGGIVSAGVRFFDAKLSVDLALARYVGKSGESPWIPYLGFVYKF